MKKYRWIMNIVVVALAVIGFLVMNTSSDTKPVVAKPSTQNNAFKR